MWLLGRRAFRPVAVRSNGTLIFLKLQVVNYNLGKRTQSDVLSNSLKLGSLKFGSLRGVSDIVLTYKAKNIYWSIR